MGDMSHPRHVKILEQWMREAKYIQKMFIDGYYTETFKMKDEQEKFIMSSYIPRHQRKGVDSNLITEMEPVITDSGILEEPYIKHIAMNVQWPEYHSKTDNREVIIRVVVTSNGKEQETTYTVKPWAYNLNGIFKDIFLDMNPEKKDITNIVDIDMIDFELALQKAGLSSDDGLVMKAWGLRPYEKYYPGAEWNQYRPGVFCVHMTARDIADLLGWDEKRVNTSMKRIKRATKNEKLRDGVRLICDETPPSPKQVIRSRWPEMEKLINNFN